MTTSISLTTSLHAFQAAGADKLGNKRVGALFMWMGTGKTRTAIELVHRRQTRIDRVVIFAPVDLKKTWRYEILKHTTATAEDVYVFGDRTTTRRLPMQATWYVVGIESMSASDRVVLSANRLLTEHTFVIVDESDFIKGPGAKRTRRITRLSQRARYRLILTGTPLSQGVEDLYAQMRFLSPDILGYRSFYAFAHRHLVYSERYPELVVGHKNMEELAQRIEPFVYQLGKDALDLPERLFDERIVSLSSEQERYYQQAKEELLLSVPEEDIDSILIFRLFTALQQIASGFWNRRPLLERDPPPEALRRHDELAYWYYHDQYAASCYGTHAGWDFTADPEHIEMTEYRSDHLLSVVRTLPEDAQVLILCKFAYSLHRVATRLTEEYGADQVVAYHGGLSEREREAEEARFHDGKSHDGKSHGARFFVATLGTGSRGLTLNEATYTIFYESSFKFSQRQQAMDRNHRIGQDRQVTYIDLWAECGIEDRIKGAMAVKGDAVRSFQDEVKALSKAELKQQLLSV